MLPRETGQAGAPCEPPVEAGHVCGLRSNFLCCCRGAAATVDGLGIGSLAFRCVWGSDHMGFRPLGDQIHLGIGQFGLSYASWGLDPLGIGSPGDMHIYDLCTDMSLDFICYKLCFAYMS